jgi:uncharacterized membrane protein YgcG
MKISPKLLRLFVIVFLGLNLNLILFLSSSFAQYFTIQKFHSEITIQEDSSFVVEETIEVKFERPRHGIFRDIPYQYRNELGKRIKTPTTILSVTDQAGKKWKYKVETAGNALRIRIGDAKRYVKDFQTYLITYRVENAILFFDDHDELYWNVTGNAWQAPIEEASADVTLSTEKKSNNLWEGCYTGVHGSNQSECSFEGSENRGRFVAKRNLRTGEGLTIAFGWEKGLVSPPSSWKRFLWAIHLRENWVFLLPIFTLAFMISQWYRKGRDPKVRESITVMYEPPKFNHQPLSPAEVGALIDEKLDPRDITSTLLGLAVKGYIRIEEEKKDGLIFDKTDYYLKRLKASDENLSPFEKKLMEALFPMGSPGTLVSNLKNKFYTELESLKKTLYGELVTKKYFPKNPEKIKNSYAKTGFFVMVFAFFVFIFLVPGSIVRSIVAGIFTGLPVMVFARFMPAKTRAGASAYMGVLGFQEFLNRAEKDRLERMGDVNLFSKFLPYAVALDVAENWARAFEGIYQDPPNWYVSPGGFGTFHPYSFTHSISSVTSNLSSVMYSAPRGSGVGGGGGLRGGGGSSGGGFGGGGGGSW